MLSKQCFSLSNYQNDWVINCPNSAEVRPNRDPRIDDDIMDEKDATLVDHISSDAGELADEWNKERQPTSKVEPNPFAISWDAQETSTKRCHPSTLVSRIYDIYDQDGSDYWNTHNEQPREVPRDLVSSTVSRCRPPRSKVSSMSQLVDI
jgi:hypothetical protein